MNKKPQTSKLNVGFLFSKKIKIKDKKLKKFITNIDTNKKFYYDNNFLICKGLCDVHVHFREPGFSYKETIKCGSEAAAHGGYTTVCTMPNLKPAPDSLANLNKQLQIINKDAVIDVIPYGRITKDNKNELADLSKLKKYVVAFSDDGKGVQDDKTMLKAMRLAKKLNKIIVAHCEDTSLIKKGGCIHDGKYAEEHGYIGISSSSEFKQVERDLKLVKLSKVKYHVCHVSTKESVELIRQAKKIGLDVTCETAPHYLLLSEENLINNGRFKMNPPLRSKLDQKALIKGIIDGTIDMIATDHAPHTNEEKNKGLKGSAFGIVGLETSFPILYTNLVKKKIISLDKLISLLTYNPRRRFNLKDNGFTIFEINKEYKIDSKKFLSKGKSTPFDQNKVFGKCILTVSNNKIVYKDKQYIN